MGTEHAVIGRFQHRFDDLSELHGLEDELTVAIESAGVGEFDGSEVASDGSDVILYMYRPDADRLFEAIKPVLVSSAFIHEAVATKRYGPAEDGVKEVHVSIGSNNDREHAERSGTRKRKTPKAIKYEEGDLFAVPLRQGGFGICLVTRRAKGGCTLGYFFGPRTSRPASLDTLPALQPQNAYLVGWFGDLGIRDGRWIPIGRVSRWRRDRWPIPVFGRTDALEHEGWKCFYDDDGNFLREEPISVHAAKSLPEDGLMGSGAAEIRLTKILSAN